jgi:hypothetical protein
LRTYCAIPAAPLGDFCTESLLGKDFDFVHLLCYYGCTLGRLLRGVSHARVSALPLVVTSEWSNAEDRRCGLLRHAVSEFLWGIFAGILHGSASLKTSPREEKSAGRNSTVWWITRARRP